MGPRPPNPKCAHIVSPGHLAGRSGLWKHEAPGPRLNCREDEELGLSSPYPVDPGTQPLATDAAGSEVHVQPPSRISRITHGLVLQVEVR